MKINTLVDKYFEERDNDLISEIYEEAVRNTKAWMYHQGTMRFNEFPETFPQEVALEFISRVYEDRITNTPYAVLLSIARGGTAKLIQVPVSDKVKSHRTVFCDPTEQLLFEEHLEQTLSVLPLALKGGFAYLLHYPKEFERIRALYKTSALFYLVAAKLFKTRREFFLSQYDFKVPNTKTAQALLLAALYNLSPILMVMVLLTEDLSKFFQLCLLFGGKKVEIPTLTTAVGTVVGSTELGKTLDDGKSLTDDQKELLASFCIDKKQGESLALIPSAYFQRILTSLTSSYETFQDRLVKGLDVCNPDEVRKVYEVLAKEMGTQSAIFGNILQLLDGGIIDGKRSTVEEG